MDGRRAPIVSVANAHAGGRMVSSLEGGYDLTALGQSAARACQGATGRVTKTMGSITLARHGEPCAVAQGAADLGAIPRLVGRATRWAASSQAQTPPSTAGRHRTRGLTSFSPRRGGARSRPPRRSRPIAMFTQDDDLIEAPLPPPALPRLDQTLPAQMGRDRPVLVVLSSIITAKRPGRRRRGGRNLVAAALIERAETGDDVLVLAHGFFNLMVGRSLRRRGVALHRRWRLPVLVGPPL